MVFSSLPLYLDPPNWPPQSNQDELLNNQHLPPQPQPGGGNGVDRPGSTAERARQAKIPQPEAALKCPRCESTNTKFCYFNNYNLSQPRHFCKTCRRYWTRGGALRNVPVGGGCRRNKRSKSKTKSKPSDRSQTQSNSSYGCTNGHMSAVVPPQLPSLQNLGNPFISGAVGANYGGIQTNGSMEQWRLQQGPECHFMSNNGLYPFDGEGIEAPSYGGGQLRGRQLDGGGGGVDVTQLQLANLKVEGNDQGVNLSRNFFGLSGNYDLNHQIWGGNNAWTDLSAGFTAASSATSHLL